MVKILRKSLENHEAQFPTISVFIGQKSIFRYCIQNVKDGIRIQVYNINNESVSNFSQFISVKVKKNLRKFQTQFREKLRKLRLRQSDGFLIKKRVHNRQVCAEWEKHTKSMLQINSFMRHVNFTTTGSRSNSTYQTDVAKTALSAFSVVNAKQNFSPVREVF